MTIAATHRNIGFCRCVAMSMVGAFLLAAGCGGNGTNGGSGGVGGGGEGGGAGGSGGGTTPGPEPITSAACGDPTAKISITDETNYSLSDSFTIERSVLKDATDLTFDWSGLTHDFFGKSLDPANDIDLILISLWKLTPDGIEDALQHDSLALRSNLGVLTTCPDGSYTKKNLLDFEVLCDPLAPGANPIPPEEIWKRFDTSNPNFQYPQDQYRARQASAHDVLLHRRSGGDPDHPGLDR
jgi:hypothetical protein